ncbi:MAG: cysteine--tRNA ligase [Candidatus Diapherotrites archaeon]|nr:cysteine--tRNA ligase [Candidatus Diapherotrites archaeon]
MLKFYNTLSRKLEAFKPISDNRVGIYTCGPTVYNAPHIGNYRAFLWEDVLVRYLRYRGYTVNHVMNLTDVDDKTIRGSRTEGIPLNDFTAKYKKIFFDDLKKINVVPADVYPAATEHIPEMVAIIKALLKKGLAYKAPDGSVYFSIKDFPSYGKLSKFKIKKLKEGARVAQDEYEKEEAKDFALWKAWDESDGDVYWQTELGKGRPGWHIECSAMSSKYLGPSFDIHTGGIDNMFPHHENEIAQSEGATGKPFVKYWLHARHLLVNGEKMSKSKGNFLMLSDLERFNPLAIRLVLISNHYRKSANFTFSEVEKAQERIAKINETIQRLLGVIHQSWLDIPIAIPQVPSLASKAILKFEAGMDDDLNVPKALLGLNELVKRSNAILDQQKMGPPDAESLLKAFKKIDSVLGVFSFEPKAQESLALDPKIEALINKRDELRAQKKWKESDLLRDELLEKGIELFDTPQGTRWKKKAG